MDTTIFIFNEEEIYHMDDDIELYIGDKVEINNLRYIIVDKIYCFESYNQTIKYILGIV